MITRFYADNFRCFVNFECLLRPKQLLLGSNGSGKSTLFEVLGLLRDFCAYGDDVEDRLIGTRTRWSDVIPQTFELDVVENGGEYRFKLILDSWGQPSRPRVVLEEVQYAGKPIFRFSEGEVQLYNDQQEETVRYPFDWRRSALATIAERADNTKLSRFRRWLADLFCFSPDPRRMSAIAVREASRPECDLANFASWYRHLRQETSDYEYLHDLREVIEGFWNMRLGEAGERRRELRVTMKSSEGVSKREDEYTLGELSDGQRVLIGLYAILHFALKPGATICIDEPDNFIALREIQPWLCKVLDRVEDEQSNSQVLIASHHPELLNRMAFQDGLSLDRPYGRHTRVRLFDDPLQTGLAPAELVSRGWEHE